MSPITTTTAADDPALARKISPTVEGGVRGAVARRLASFGEVDEARAAVALVLAQALDDGAGLSTAAVARELRACLADLEVGKDDDGQIGEFVRRLRVAEVGNRTIG